MTGREKIVIAAMAVVVAYGAYQYLAPGPKDVRATIGGAGKKRGAPFEEEIREKLKKLDINPADACIIARGGAKWPANPFFHGNLKMPEKEAVEKKTIPMAAAGRRLKFSGYIKAGDKILAIINGMEYEVGEFLMGEGLFVKSIFPDRVVVARVDSPDDITLALDPMGSQATNAQGLQ